MLTRFHKILLAALAVQLVLIAIVLTRGDEAVVKDRPLIAGLDPAKVTRLQVFTAGEGKPIDLVKQDAGWVLASGYGYPVDAARVTDVLAPIAKAMVGEPIASQAARHKQLRVADGELERKLVITTGGKDVTLYIGGPAGARRTAVRLGGEDQVYGVTGVSAATAGGEARLWVDPSYVRVPAGEVAKVTVERDGGSVELTKLAAAPAAGAGSDGVPPPATDRWTATVGGAAIALGKDEVIDDAAIERIVNAATMIDLSAPADPKRDASKPTATITIERKAASAAPPGAGSGSAAQSPPPPAAPVVIDVIADGTSYWVHDRSAPRAVLVDKARLDDVVTAGRDKLVKKPAPPVKQSATPAGLPPGMQLPPGVTLPGAAGPG